MSRPGLDLAMGSAGTACRERDGTTYTRIGESQAARTESFSLSNSLLSPTVVRVLTPRNSCPRFSQQCQLMKEPQGKPFLIPRDYS